MRRKILIPIIFSFISAIFLRLTFPKTCFFFLAYVALVPFLIVLIQTNRARNAFLFGWLFGFCFHYLNIFWLNTLITYNVFIPFGIALLGIYLGMYGGIFGWIGFHLHKHFPRLFMILLPCLWVVLEYIRNVGQLAFPWSFLSTTQWKVLPLIQICDITGPWIISFFIVLVNVVISQFIVGIIANRSKEEKHATWKNLRSSATSVIPGIGLMFLVGLIIFGYGFVRLAGNFNGDHGINVAILQPNIPQRVKYASYSGSDDERENLSSILESLNFEMLKELQKGDCNLVVLPESVFTRHYFAYDKKIQEKIGLEAQRFGAGIFLGADREIFYTKQGNLARSREEIEEIKAYNSAWYFLPNGKLYSETYDKIQLVPFGEHLPYFDLIPGFQRIIVQTGSFQKGKHYTLFPLYTDSEFMGQGPDYYFSSMICFESSFGWLLRRFVKKGADFLIIITNDGWYEDSAGPYQHFILSVIRAVETRRWIVRCSNRGVSALISPKGEIFHQTQLNKKATIIGKIYPRKNHTFYQMAGDWMILPYLIPLLGAFAIILRFSKKMKRKKAQNEGKSGK